MKLMPSVFVRGFDGIHTIQANISKADELVSAMFKYSYLKYHAMRAAWCLNSLDVLNNPFNQPEWFTVICNNLIYYGDLIMGTTAFQITSLTIVYSTVYSDADQRKHRSSASLAFVWGIHRGPVNSPHKWPVTRKMFPFDDVIMIFHKNIARHTAHAMVCFITRL